MPPYTRMLWALLCFGRVHVPPFRGTFRAGNPCWYPPWYVPLRYLYLEGPAGCVALDSSYDPDRLHTPIRSQLPLFKRVSSYCYEQRQRGFCPTIGSLLSYAQKDNRGGPLFRPKPWLLQLVISSPEEGWGFATYTRSAQAELLPLQREIQDADAQDHSFPGPRVGLVHHCRLEGCLLPHPGG